MSSTSHLGAFESYFRADPHVGVWVVDRGLRVRFATEAADRLILDGLDASLTGLELGPMLPDAVSQNLRTRVSRVLESGSQETFRGVWRGRRLRCIYMPSGEDDAVMVVTRPEPGGFSAEGGAGPDVEDSQYVELGRFSMLTPRELEVLAYFGMGLGIQDTAKEIHRAVTTVKRFREGLARKLNIPDRCRLGQLARDYGLLPEHATLPRVELPGSAGQADAKTFDS